MPLPPDYADYEPDDDDDDDRLPHGTGFVIVWAILLCLGAIVWSLT